MKYTYQKDGYKPTDEIFVFGSNLAGRHGAGAAKEALKTYKAIWGNGIGWMGNCYAIPTKDHFIKTLPVIVIARYVEAFLKCARLNPQHNFYVSRIGCGLAGFSDADIAPMFVGAPENCSFAEQWVKYLDE